MVPRINIDTRRLLPRHATRARTNTQKSVRLKRRLSQIQIVSEMFLEFQRHVDWPYFICFSDFCPFCLQAQNCVKNSPIIRNVLCLRYEGSFTRNQGAERRSKNVTNRFYEIKTTTLRTTVKVTNRNMHNEATCIIHLENHESKFLFYT